jgi:alkylhydroperoxidase/carboxymuconolactone decarboxylase family protein YurZ
MKTLTSVVFSDASQHSKSEGRLQNVIPIVMVIVGGCEPCAEKMVTRALEQGSSWEDIDKTLRIVADMQKRDCFAKCPASSILSGREF